MNQNLKKKGVLKMCENRRFHHHEGQCCEKEDGDCDYNNGEQDCKCGDHFHRHYQTKEEEHSHLESYLADLKLEVKAVEERLANS